MNKAADNFRFVFLMAATLGIMSLGAVQLMKIQLVDGSSGSRSSGTGSSGGRSVGRAASQRENTGSGHDAHERNKGSAFHR